MGADRSDAGPEEQGMVIGGDDDGNERGGERYNWFEVVKSCSKWFKVVQGFRNCFAMVQHSSRLFQIVR